MEWTIDRRSPVLSTFEYTETAAAAGGGSGVEATARNIDVCKVY